MACRLSRSHLWFDQPYPASEQVLHHALLDGAGFVLHGGLLDGPLLGDQRLQCPEQPVL